VSLVVAGTVRVPPEQIEGLRPHMTAMMTASRAEDGCVEYAYGFDLAVPGLVRVFEIWRDQAALDAHARSAHMARWRAAWPQFGVSDRRLSVYEIASERAI
jgi:quinol monooxygenase YgiN